MSSPAEEAVKKANRLADGGDGEAAAKVLEEYLSGDPDNRDARLLLARTAVYVLKDADRGIAQLDIILERHPDDPDALKALATVLMKKKKNNKRADECYRKLTETCPDAEVYNAYAVFLRMQMLDFQRSAEFYEKAIAASPKETRYHRNYAVLLLNDVRDYVKAKEELETVMRADPGDLSAKKNYDLLMRKKFDSEGNLKGKRFGLRRP